MKSALPVGAIALGILLFIISMLWSTLFPPAARWTPEKASRSIEVKARLSNLGPLVNAPPRSMHSGPDPASLKSEYDALVKENEELNAEFESAAESPKSVSRFLKWSGLAIALVGIIGFYAVKQTE